MISFDFFYKHNVKEATIDIFLTAFNYCPNTGTYVCMLMHEFVLTHGHTHMHIITLYLDC